MRMKYTDRPATRNAIDHKVRDVVQQLVRMPGKTVNLNVVDGDVDQRFLQAVAYMADVDIADKSFTAMAGVNDNADVNIDVLVNIGHNDVDVSLSDSTLTLTTNQRHVMDDITLISDAVRENMYGRNLYLV